MGEYTFQLYQPVNNPSSLFNMPIVLDDSILIPPSLRRGPPPRVYNVQPGTTTTTVIESGFPHVPHRPLTPPRSPVIIHQETTSYIPPKDDLGGFRGEVEYVSPGSRRRLYLGSDSGRSPRYRSHSISAPYEGGSEVSRSRRYYDDDEEYYLEDGSRHGSYAEDFEYSGHPRGHHGHEDYPGPHESEGHHRRVRHLTQAGLAAGALGAAKEIHNHQRRGRVEDEYYSDSSDGDHGHHKGRKVAAVALGATAAGAAAGATAHHMYQRRHRSRARSSDPYTSSDTDHHTGRKVAGAALGATAASIAAHKIHQRRQKSRSSSRSSSSDREHPRHRKAKLAAAAIGTGLAARHIRHRRDARSRSSSTSPPRERQPWGRHLAAAALGATAGLAHHEYKHHHQPERPRPVMRRSYSDGGLRERRKGIFSRNRSPSPHKHSKLKKAAAATVAAAIAKKAIDHYREGRSRSRSSSRSPERRHGPFHRDSHSRSRHRIGVPEAVAATMIGAGIAAHQKHKEKKREKEMHGHGVAVPDREAHRVHHGSSPPYAHPGGSLNGGYAETIDSDTTTTTPRDFIPPSQDRNRSQRQDLDAEFVDESTGHAPDQRRSLGDGLSPEAIAYKLGQKIGGHTNDTGRY